MDKDISLPINTHAAGFSLGEVLVSISVLMLLLSIAVPSYISALESQKIKRLATEIEWLLTNARSYAMAQGVPTQVNIQNIESGNSANTPDLGWNIEAIRQDNKDLLYQIAGKNFSDITINKTLSDNITFNPQTGRINNVSGRFKIYVKPEKQVHVIVNNMTGRIYVCSPTKGYGYGKCSS